MKVYNLDNRGSVTPQIAAAIGLIAHQTQADVIVAASTRSAAFVLLAQRGLAPTSDRYLRLDVSTPTGQLIAAGVLTDGVVLVHQLTSSNTPVVRIEWDGGHTKVGEFVRGEFVRVDSPLDSPDGAAAVTVTQADLAAVAGYADVAEMVLAQLSSSMDRLNAMEAELTRARTARSELCRRAAYDLKIAGRAAEAMDISPGRVYQLATNALRARASQGEYLPGLWVEIIDPDRMPENYTIAYVVERPADWVNILGGPEDPKDPVVFVQAPAVFEHPHENTFQVRSSKIRVWVPPCAQCPPEEQLHIRSIAGLSVHQVSKHGGRS